MVTFDSVALSNILLACIAFVNIIILAMLYERFVKKRVIIIKQNKKKDVNENS